MALNLTTTRYSMTDYSLIFRPLRLMFRPLRIMDAGSPSLSLEAQDKAAELGSCAGRARTASADPGPAQGIRSS